MVVMIMAEKPLMLKDYLEIDSQAESLDGFRCYPRLADAATVRHLLDAELRGAGKRFTRPRSAKGGGGAITRISAAIKLKLLPSSSSSSSAAAAAPEGSDGEGFLFRSFSKRIKGGFWKKRAGDSEGEGEGGAVRKRSVRVKDIVRLRSFEEIEERRSFGCPSPVVSSCSSSLETESSSSSGSDFMSSSIGSSEFLDEIESTAAAKKSSPPRSPRANPNPRVCTEETATGEPKVMEEGEAMEEEKEQLSPIAVMDFPYEDENEDDEDATTPTTSSSSPSFQQSLANIERTKLQLLQKIRRFESLAELDPVDLDTRFAASSDDDEEADPACHAAASDDDAPHDEDEAAAGGGAGLRSAQGLLALLGPTRGSSEKLLVDFFIEGLARSSPAEALLEAAKEWIGGGGGGGGGRRRCWELRDDRSRGEWEIREMESNGRWRSFDGEERRELNVDLAGMVLDSLIEEVASEGVKKRCNGL